MRGRWAVLGSTVVVALALGGPLQAQEEERSSGLPFTSRIEWTFNFDAAFGAFGFNNSLYTNPHPDPSGDLSDNWQEAFVKPALSASYRLGTSELYGKASAVGERTFSVSPDLVGGDASSYFIDEAFIGWRSGTALPGLGENALDIAAGRVQYNLGTGFLLWDGAGEGGSRGGYWSNARKAFELGAVGRLNTGAHKLEIFYLDKDEVPESESESWLWGANYELSIAERVTLGATYMGWGADADVAPQRDELQVYDFRVYATPFASLPLSLEGEYAIEDNGDALDSNGWYVQASFAFEKVFWQPTLYYRYAAFAGDDPDTGENEAFDPLFLGFYDWGTWWQGEIAGEYFLSNSNLLSHEVRLHLTPIESIGTGLISFLFTADEPGSFCGEVTCATADDLGFELDWYMDWSLNDNFTASFIAAWARPGDAIEQAYGRDEDFSYGMFFLSYSY